MGKTKTVRNIRKMKRITKTGKKKKAPKAKTKGAFLWYNVFLERLWYTWQKKFVPCQRLSMPKSTEQK